jgi:outer membrane protein assembly factor BamB
VPPARKSKKGKVIAFTTIGLVLALVGVWFAIFSSNNADNDGEDGGAPPAASTPGGLLWGLNEEAAEDGDRPKAFWHVGDTVVKVGVNRMTAYSLADGSELWTQEFAGMCVPETTTDDGRVVIGWGEHNCGENISLVDLNTGETGWTRPLEPETWPLNFRIAMAGESYAVHTGGGWNLHRVEDGEVIDAAEAGYDALGGAVASWDAANPREVTEGEELCAVDGVAGGEALIRRLTCATVVSAEAGQMSDPRFEIQEIDPATGEEVWRLDVPDGKWLSKIHSVSPLVVSFRSEEFGRDTDLAFISEGQITAQIPIEQAGIQEADAHLFIEDQCRDDIVVYSALADCGGVAVHDNVVYMTSNSDQNPVTALDATTGEVLWRYTVGDDFYRQAVLGADENGVFVHQTGYTDEPGHVVRLSLDGQRAEPLFQTGNAFLRENFFMFFSEDRLFYSPPDYSLEQDILAYGADGGRRQTGNSETSGEGGETGDAGE